MALNVSAWSIRNPLPPIVATAALIAIGMVSFYKLPITRMPNVDVPVIAVVITQFGANPAELESQVAKKVEDAVAGVEGVAVRFRYVAFKTCECVHALQTEGEGA